MIISIVVVISLLVAGMSFMAGTFSSLPGAVNDTEQPYSYIIFKNDAGLTCAKNTHTQIIEYASSDAQNILESVLAIVNGTANSGTIYIKAGIYDLDPTVLPASASGYCLQGEFVGTNDAHTGTLFRAKTTCNGTYMIDLSNSYHSNNIQLRDISFSANGVAVTTLVNLSQSASACSRFTVRDCEFFTLTGSPISDASDIDCVLNFDNNEDGVIDHCVVSTWYDHVGLKFRTPGGFARIYECSLGGITYIGGMQCYMEANIIGSGGINITSTLSANNNIQLNGCWIESNGAYKTLIQNWAGQPATIFISGGRWNSQGGHAFLYAGAGSPIYCTLANLVINSNDGSSIDFFDDNSSADLICMNPSYNPLSNNSISGCTAIYGAKFNYGHFERTYGAVVIPGGNLSYAYDHIIHGLYDTPTGVLLTSNNTDNANFTAVYLNWKNSLEFSVILNGYTNLTTDVYWEAWV